MGHATGMWRVGAWAAALSAALALAGCGGGSGSGSAPQSAAADGPPDQTIQAVLPSSGTTARAAVRLADHASFGPSEALVANIRTLGPEAWVADQLTRNSSRYTSGQGGAIHQPEGTDFCADKGDACYRDWYSTQPLLWDFYRNALTQPDQLRQRVAFALAQILVISEVELSGTYGFRRYHNNLLQGAFGNYRELLRQVTLSPMMGEYLDHVNNDRELPNENFARELLQLFSLGTCLLNADGSLVGGRCQATYDNTTVRHYAHALTGWTYPAGGSSVWGCWPEGANCRYLDGDMVAAAALHDQQPRQLLGGVLLSANRTPAQALNAVLDSLMAHANMPPFIARQMIQHLVKSNPTPAYVRRVAQAFSTGRYSTSNRNFGTGQRGDMAATVAAVLLDTEARNSAPPLVAEKLREPVLMMTGVLRALNGVTDGDAMGWWWGDELKQHLFRSPSVFNFYSPSYPVAGTTLVGPAFGIHNANTHFSRLNYLNQMLYWGGVQADASIPAATGTGVDLSAFLADAGNAAKLVDRLLVLANSNRTSAASRAQIINAVNAWPIDDPDSDWRSERVRTAAYLVFAAPAYQVLN